MALELARRGIRVVVLESGPRHDFGRAVRLRPPLPPGRESLANEPARAGSPHHGRRCPLPPRREAGAGGRRQHAPLGGLHASGSTPTTSGCARSTGSPTTGRSRTMTSSRTTRVPSEALGVAGNADDPWASPRSTPFPLPAFPFSYSDGLFAPACRSAGDRVPFTCPRRVTPSPTVAARSAGPAGNLPRSVPRAPRPASTSPTSRRPRPRARRASSPTRPSLRLEVDRSRQVTAAVYARPDKDGASG